MDSRHNESRSIFSPMVLWLLLREIYRSDHYYGVYEYVEKKRIQEESNIYIAIIFYNNRFRKENWNLTTG